MSRSRDLRVNRTHSQRSSNSARVCATECGRYLSSPVAILLSCSFLTPHSSVSLCNRRVHGRDCGPSLQSRPRRHYRPPAAAALSVLPAGCAQGLQGQRSTTAPRHRAKGERAVCCCILCFLRRRIASLVSQSPAAPLSLVRSQCCTNCIYVCSAASEM